MGSALALPAVPITRGKGDRAPRGPLSSVQPGSNDAAQTCSFPGRQRWQLRPLSSRLLRSEPWGTLGRARSHTQRVSTPERLLFQSASRLRPLVLSPVCHWTLPDRLPRSLLWRVAGTAQQVAPPVSPPRWRVGCCRHDLRHAPARLSPPRNTLRVHGRGLLSDALPPARAGSRSAGTRVGSVRRPRGLCPLSARGGGAGVSPVVTTCADSALSVADVPRATQGARCPRGSRS